MGGKWGAPIMYTLDTGSLGAQLGSTSTDYVLLVISQRGADKVLSGKLELVLAPPPWQVRPERTLQHLTIRMWTSCRIAIEGAVRRRFVNSASMASDDDANKSLYGKEIHAAQMA